jgi:4-hydroxythreonine-4-phosphate dehydrogenase
MSVLPRLLITLGDVAGIGPEVAVRAWLDPDLHALCRPIIVGNAVHLRRALQSLRLRAKVEELDRLESLDLLPTANWPTCLFCLRGSEQELDDVLLGQVDKAAGRAAYDFLCTAIDLTLAGQAAGIVTLPLHKEGLRAAGLAYPGHTEILAERTGAKRHAMALHVPAHDRQAGLTVTHVTLHVALRDVFGLLTIQSILDKIELTDTMLRRLLGHSPRLGVCGLNPHASDGGLFGDEERNTIAPAIEAARAQGIDATGPWPSDTLFVRAVAGEFDGVVAMYHDQGHIAIKLLAGYRAVNVSLGLPIVRTSVAHGTAYDIAGKGIADHKGLIEAARLAARLTGKSHDHTLPPASRGHTGQPGATVPPPGAAVEPVAGESRR